MSFPFLTVKPPSPLLSSVGVLVQPGPPIKTKSVLPSPLKSPLIAFTPDVFAQVGSCGIQFQFSALKLPSPLLTSVGVLVQPGPPMKATSLRFGEFMVPLDTTKLTEEPGLAVVPPVGF